MDLPPAVDESSANAVVMSRATALVCLHVAVLLFGVAALFGKWLTLPPTTIVFGRSLIAGLALGALLFLRGERAGRFDWRLPANGVVLGVHWVAFFQAIQVSTVATGLLGYASFPLFVFLLETLLGRRPVRATALAGAMLVALGLVLLVPEFGSGEHALAGLLWGILSGFTFALLAIGNRALTMHRSAGAIALWQNACAALCLLPFVVFYPVAITPADAALLTLLGVVCTAAAHTLFIRSMRVVAAQTAGVVAALEPVYGIALAALFLGELPGARTLIGAAFIIGATVFVTLRSGK